MINRTQHAHTHILPSAGSPVMKCAQTQTQIAMQEKTAAPAN